MEFSCLGSKKIYDTSVGEILVGGSGELLSFYFPSISFLSGYPISLSINIKTGAPCSLATVAHTGEPTFQRWVELQQGVGSKWCGVCWRWPERTWESRNPPHFGGFVYCNLQFSILLRPSSNWNLRTLSFTTFLVSSFRKIWLGLFSCKRLGETPKASQYSWCLARFSSWSSRVTNLN